MPKGRKSGCKATRMAPRKIITFNVGVYFPDRDVLNFFVKCHGFHYKGKEAFFYLFGEMGMKEFVASFTHVAYVILQDDGHSKPPSSE